MQTLEKLNVEQKQKLESLKQQSSPVQNKTLAVNDVMEDEAVVQAKVQQEMEKLQAEMHTEGKRNARELKEMESLTQQLKRECEQYKAQLKAKEVTHRIQRHKLDEV